MTRYHVSSDGQPRPCTATTEACPLREEDGSPTPHGDFDTPSEAQRFAEKINGLRYGGSFSYGDATWDAKELVEGGIQNQVELEEARALLKILVDSNPQGDTLDAAYDLEHEIHSYEEHVGPPPSPRSTEHL